MNCPICLKKLDDSDLFLRICTLHIEKGGQPIYVTQNPNDIYCQPDCIYNNGVGDVDGVFLSHNNCEATNIFWNSTDNKVIIPGDSLQFQGNEAEHRMLVDGVLQSVRIRHWQVGLLRKLAEIYPERREMWFPLALIRTVATKRDKPTGARVALVGKREAGKTVLAIQSMLQSGYNLSSQKRIAMGDYIFSNISEFAVDQPALNALYLLSLHAANSPYSYRLSGTRTDEGSVKTVFIRRVQQVPNLIAVNDSTPKPEKPSWHKIKTLKTSIANFVRIFNSELNEDPANAQHANNNNNIDSNNDSSWYTILFYDIAGELYRNASKPVSNLMRCINEQEEFCYNKIAFVVDIQDILATSVEEAIKHKKSIISGDQPNSINTVLDRLDSLIKQQTHQTEKCCLIITKLDLYDSKVALKNLVEKTIVMHELTKLDKQDFSGIIDNFRKGFDKTEIIADDLDGTEITKLVQFWLKSSNHTHPDMNDDDFVLYLAKKIIINILDQQDFSAIVDNFRKKFDNAKAITDDLDNDRQDEAINLTQSWLSINSTATQQAFSRVLKDFGKIFFVWTKNLSESSTELNTTTTSDPVHSYGITKFMCWCLGVSWREIISE